MADGMRYVIVNGIVAVDGGRYTGAMAGRALRRVGAAGTPASGAGAGSTRRQTFWGAGESNPE